MRRRLDQCLSQELLEDEKKEKRPTDQREGVVGLHQLLNAILFQHHHSSQRRALGSGAVLAVHHVALLGAVLAGDEQQVEHLHLRTRSKQPVLHIYRSSAMIRRYQ